MYIHRKIILIAVLYLFPFYCYSFTDIIEFDTLFNSTLSINTTDSIYFNASENDQLNVWFYAPETVMLHFYGAEAYNAYGEGQRVPIFFTLCSLYFASNKTFGDLPMLTVKTTDGSSQSYELRLSIRNALVSINDTYSGIAQKQLSNDYNHMQWYYVDVDTNKIKNLTFLTTFYTNVSHTNVQIVAAMDYCATYAGDSTIHSDQIYFDSNVTIQLSISENSTMPLMSGRYYVGIITSYDADLAYLLKICTTSECISNAYTPYNNTGFSTTKYIYNSSTSTSIGVYHVFKLFVFCLLVIIH